MTTSITYRKLDVTTSSPSLILGDTEGAHANSAENRQPVIVYPERSLRFQLGFASICMCCFMATIDTVIVATALPAITKALKATSNQAYWCGTGFLFAQTISQPLYGAVMSIIGHKPCAILAIGIFLFASVLCATAQNVSWLVAVRVIQGIGAGGINAMVNVLTADIVPLQDRGKYVGMVQGTAAIGLVFGVILGAAIGERSTWRLIFWINIPVCTFAAAGIFYFIKLPHTKTDLSVKLKTIDWIGMMLLSGSLTGVLYGITAGGVLYPWSSARIILSLVLGFIGTVAFVLYEGLVTSSPVIPLRIFATRTAASGYFSTFVLGLTLWSLIYYLILYFLVARGHSLLHSATEILPGIASIPILAAIFGFMMASTKVFQPFMLAAWVFFALGTGLLGIITPTTPIAWAYGFQLVLAVGGGILFPGRVLSVQAPQKLEADIPVATTMVSFFTSLGEAFGVGIGGSILQNRWSHFVDLEVRNGVISKQYLIPSPDAERSAEIITHLPPAIAHLYRSIMSRSLSTLFITLGALSGIAFVATFAQRNISLAEKNHTREQEKPNLENSTDVL